MISSTFRKASFLVLLELFADQEVELLHWLVLMLLERPMVQSFSLHNVNFEARVEVAFLPR